MNNFAITPKSTKKALLNLPYSYIKKVEKELCFLYKIGKAEKKVYSKTHIVKVKKGLVYNEDVMTALVNVGLREIAKKKQFGIDLKK